MLRCRRPEPRVAGKLLVGRSALTGYRSARETETELTNSTTESTQYRYPEAIVTPAWLEQHLNTPEVRIFDCTTYLVAPDDQSSYQVVSGRDDYLKAHGPGAAFLDLEALSVADSPYRFTLPPLDDLAQRFAKAGIDDSCRVVLTTRGSLQWATRIWWMLRAVGFDKAAILDGGWERWQAEGRPTESGENHYPAGSFKVTPRPELFTGRQGVLDAMHDGQSCVINALSAQLHAGESARYGRAGRIPGSVNVPAAALRDEATGSLIDAPAAAALFASVGTKPDTPTVIYCGGGIAATLDAFVLHQLGHENLSVYDNSLSEWCSDPKLPMEIG